MRLRPSGPSSIRSQLSSLCPFRECCSDDEDLRNGDAVVDGIVAAAVDLFVIVVGIWLAVLFDDGEEEEEEKGVEGEYDTTEIGSRLLIRLESSE